MPGSRREDRKKGSLACLHPLYGGGHAYAQHGDLFPLAANLFVISFILYRRRWLPAQAGVLLLWLPWSPSFVVQSSGV